ncbi:MAG: hypothetical protein IKX36_01925 [Prevotella sp.]|nr:hypothetical protein [Prevotella sp.]
MIFYNGYIRPEMNGDLGILGKMRLADSIPSEGLKRQYSELFDEKDLKDTIVDVITIGDSFSRQGEDGFQNYLAHNGLKVLNFFPRQNMFQTAYDLMNLGIVDSTHVKTIIVESIERDFINVLSYFDVNKNNVKIIKNEVRQTPTTEEPWSLTEAKNFLLLRLGLEKPVRDCRLSVNAFSGEEGDRLFFYQKDFNSFSIEHDNESVVQNKLNILFQKAEKTGIRLIFLLCPDKYDFYQNYIISNPYKRKTINEDLRILFPHNKNVVIAKEVLIPYLEKGEKDLFHFCDSHWTYKSAKIVGNYLYSVINASN